GHRRPATHSGPPQIPGTRPHPVRLRLDVGRGDARHLPRLHPAGGFRAGADGGEDRRRRHLARHRARAGGDRLGLPAHRHLRPARQLALRRPHPRPDEGDRL
ncbi:MAG: Putative membrane protein, clustering with ActP, partial [uncultured Acetobacteraceae bacterium]